MKITFKPPLVAPEYARKMQGINKWGKNVYSHCLHQILTISVEQQQQ